MLGTTVAAHLHDGDIEHEPTITLGRVAAIRESSQHQLRDAHSCVGRNEDVVRASARDDRGRGKSLIGAREGCGGSTTTVGLRSGYACPCLVNRRIRAAPSDQKVGLVLGAGGILGGAWLVAALHAIASETGGILAVSTTSSVRRPGRW